MNGTLLSWIEKSAVLFSARPIGWDLTMTATFLTARTRLLGTMGVLAIVGLWSVASVGGAEAASVLNGPINLGTSATYGALAGSTLTNTGPTTVNGDIGVSPGSSITGFTGAPNGSNVGAVNDDNSAALQAKTDLTTAYNNAAGLTPTTSGLAQLSGKSLTPGVYSGGALGLSNNGTLTLAGTAADSIWVFQAASSLTIGSATHIIITGGASACNVFWQVGSSASIGTSAQFQGTVLAAKSITVATGATVIGRLLASTAAVTLQSNSITVPSNCAAGGTPTTANSPAISSGAPPAGTAGTPYSFGVTASGIPSPTFGITDGTLPAGLALNGTTGVISGTPTTPGTSTFTVTATNSTTPAVSAIYTVAIGVPTLALAAPTLALTGTNSAPGITLGSILLMSGGLLFAVRHRRRTTR
jgi:LPXTG-motif cell wall-anchored protein